ncbi:MAG: M20/M25/M40 family metallo-hydrolase [Oscillospiraceae bacterium]|nr:M20/M25/M40 family metallo-hydrolase [Oscillospiraceae bacterium]
MWILYVILALIVLFLIVIVCRALAFKPKPETPAELEAISFNRDGAVKALAALVSCRTVSYSEPEKEDGAEFDRLTGMLPELYPNVAAECSLQRFPDRGLLFRWPGKSPGDPAVLMAHYDVVPVEEANWAHPPFSALIEDGVMWGRGTLDTKVTFNGILYAADQLISQGFRPEHDIYLAFSGCEETNGPGAEHIVEYFVQNGIVPSFVLDEGGAVVEGVFPGVSEPCAMIGIAEKGQVNLEYSVASGGGHASAPGPRTPIGILSSACKAVEAHPFPMHITKPVEAMFDTLGRRSSFAYRLIFANLWCFRGILDKICKKSGGELNALVRTTVAFTQMSGSGAPNVLPSRASMVSNIRLNPADSVASAQEYIRGAVKDDAVSIRAFKTMEPSPISDTECDGWRKVCSAVAATWKGCIVSPYLMVQCSDSRHYRDLSDRVYRFSAMDLTAEERHSIHGDNERIRLETVGRATEFFIRLIKQC